MKALYIEELAIHDDPELCVDDPRGRGEALTGECAGWPLSREINFPGCRRCSLMRKATSTAALSRVAAGPCAVRDPMHVHNLSARDPGDHMVIPSMTVEGIAQARSRP